MAWEIYYPDNTKESFPLERAPQATATPHAPLRRISVPDAPCQPRDKVTSHTITTHYLNLTFKFWWTLTGVSFTTDQTQRIGSTANRSPLFYRGFDKDLFTLSGSQPS